MKMFSKITVQFTPFNVTPHTSVSPPELVPFSQHIRSVTSELQTTQNIINIQGGAKPHITMTVWHVYIEKV
jgi:hypothetical protein